MDSFIQLMGSKHRHKHTRIHTRNQTSVCLHERVNKSFVQKHWSMQEWNNVWTVYETLKQFIQKHWCVQLHCCLLNMELKGWWT